MIDKDLARRLGRLRPPARGCRNPWHNSKAARWAVVYENIDTRETPAPPACPSCGSAPALVIEVTYEVGWRSPFEPDAARVVSRPKSGARPPR